MIIKSPDFTNNGEIPKRYTCDGGNTIPPLEFSVVPEEAKSLALIVDDPDAPMGVWTHWLVWNIDPKTTLIKEGEVSLGSVEGKNSWSKTGYGGPCPPSGTHRYFFKLYALDSLLSLPANSDKETLQKEMEGHILDRAELIGRYSR